MGWRAVTTCGRPPHLRVDSAGVSPSRAKHTGRVDSHATSPMYYDSTCICPHFGSTATGSTSGWEVWWLQPGFPTWSRFDQHHSVAQNGLWLLSGSDSNGCSASSRLAKVSKLSKRIFQRRRCRATFWPTPPVKQSTAAGRAADVSRRFRFRLCHECSARSPNMLQPPRCNILQPPRCNTVKRVATRFRCNAQLLEVSPAQSLP